MNGDEDLGYRAVALYAAPLSPDYSGAVGKVVFPEQAEIVAQTIYEQWAETPGYVPWVNHGNSTKQSEARRLAWGCLNKVKELNHGDSVTLSTENDGCSADLSTNQHQDEHAIFRVLREQGEKIAEQATEAQRKTLRDAGFCSKCHGSRSIRGTYGFMPCDQCC